MPFSNNLHNRGVEYGGLLRYIQRLLDKKINLQIVTFDEYQFPILYIPTVRTECLENWLAIQLERSAIYSVVVLVNTRVF